jgi:GNAT superfamily N-acetyltransferase
MNNPLSAPVRELSRFERPALERHLLSLDREDRRLRFGIALGDVMVRSYVARIDLQRDSLFGVYDEELRLLGAAHVARGNGQAELGLSVLSGHRNRGLGGALLERACLRARNWGVRALFMHCLAENGAMVHLVRKQRVKVVTESGEADAWLALAPADASSLFGEVFAERVAIFDYALKSQLAYARRMAVASMTSSHGRRE